MKVICEMKNRNFKIKSFENFDSYFKQSFPAAEDYLKNHNEEHIKNKEVFSQIHNDRYLLQCFYNLQEKYDHGQKDFDKNNYDSLESFIKIYTGGENDDYIRKRSNKTS